MTDVLPGFQAVPPVRDGLDRRYTPQSLADAIVDRLHLTPEKVVEPSVGGGAFVRAARRRWPSCHVTGIDLDQSALGLQQCNEAWGQSFLAYGPQWGRSPDLIIGNPPFSEALEHVRHALTFECPVVFVLPLAYLGVQAWTPLLTGPNTPAVVRPIVGRPWSVLREAACFEWHPGASTMPVQTRLELLTDWRGHG